jgi:PAS domain S-box-containing protein
MHARCEKLARERQRYAEIFSLSPSAYLMTDRYGTIVEANGAAAQLLARQARFLKGKPLEALRLRSRGTVDFLARPVLDGQNRVTGHCWLLRPASGP